MDVHYDTIKPSIEAGKAVFIEYPVAENTQRAKELADLAKQKNVPNIVGLQARMSPAVLKLKEILKSGEIGKVLSSSVSAYSPFSNRDSISEGLAYFLDKKVGGNPVIITFGHSKSLDVSSLTIMPMADTFGSDRLCSFCVGRI